MSLSFRVDGIPAPQGSKRYLGNGGMVESSKRVAPWRADIRTAAEQALNGAGRVHCRVGDAGFWRGSVGGHHELWDAPLSVTLGFDFPRPKSHYRTGRNADQLRNQAPHEHTGKPDLDKLTRAVLDALTGVVWADDAHVTQLHAAKGWADDHHPGVQISIWPVTP
jgi:crossover junction endodeoxyribonuclease RusA